MKVTIEFFLWIIFFIVVYRIIKNTIQNAVNRGIRDYEAQKEARRRKEKEITVDQKKIQDADFKDL
ncbi:MAG TPA: hypothetical protein VLX91_11615 [Candidatus Acidoferrales bacterium]|nr:hypothetical protein [Candidatus Acidoferrales bacterium]